MRRRLPATLALVPLALVPLALVTMLFCGCGFTTKMNYRDTTLRLHVQQSPVSLSVQERRQYVVSGDKSEQWIGLQRNGYGIPFGVHTESGEPLAKEFAEALRRSLEQSGVDVKPVESRVTTSKAALLGVHNQKEAARSIVLTIREWKSDTMYNLSFHYDLLLEIFDSNGESLAREVVQGTKALDASFWNPIGSSERLMVEQQQQLFEELFGRLAVRNALL